MTGILPVRLRFYQKAFRHRSTVQSTYESNERLEFLGDAVLGAVIAEYLYKKFPYRSEGYLTELRAKMVSRQQLNNVAMRLGIDELIEYNEADLLLNKRTLTGNALEALIGAIFVDKGYGAAQQFIMRRIVKPFLDVMELEIAEFNYKSKLLEWSQQNGQQVAFIVKGQQRKRHRIHYCVAVVVNNQELAVAEDTSRKNAEKAAARQAFEKLNLRIEEFI